MEVYPQLQRLVNQLVLKAYGESVEDLIAAKKAAEARIQTAKVGIQVAEAKTLAAEARIQTAKARIQAAEAKAKTAEAKATIDRKILIIKNLLKRGLSIEDVADITETTIAEIKAIKAKLNH